MMSRILSYLNKHYKAILIIVGFLLICLLLLPLGKRIYDQRLSYKWDGKNLADTLSEEPFGAYYFDQYLDSAYGKRIVKGTTIDKMSKRPCNYIIKFSRYYDSLNGYSLEYITTRQSKYIALANKGSNFVIDCDNDNISLYLGCISTGRGYCNFDPDDLKKKVSNQKISKVPLDIKTNLDPKLKEYPSIYLWDNMIHETCLYIPNDAEKEEYYTDCYHGIPQGTSSSLITLRGEGDIALRRNIGKGHITLITCPYLLTNYGISFDDGRKAVKHILDCTINPKLPVVVIYENGEADEEESYNDDNEKSMFYVLLEHPATALGLYLLLGALLLTLIFNVRRRQRAETMVEVPHNSSITYIKHLATLYKGTSDYKELLLLERRNLLYGLRKEYRFDLRTLNFTKPSEFASHIAESRSLDEKKVKDILLGLDRLCDGDGKVDADSYKYIIDSLQILNNKTTKQQND